MYKILNFEKFINESVLFKDLTLYHGTCAGNAENLIKNGWKPMNMIGGNLGNPNYLYLTSDPEDAEWFSNEKGCNSIVQISNIPLDYLRPDPEDESGYSMNELLDRMKKTRMPSKFILIESLPYNHFKIYKK